MATGRLLQKRISNSKKMARLSCDGARLLYSWLLAHLDSNGNFYADPVMINNLVFTRLGKSVKEIEKWLDELENLNCIIRYEVDGEVYLNYPDFFEKQPNIRPDREGKSDIPNVSPDNILKRSGSNPDLLHLNRIEENRKEENICSSVISFLNEKAGSDFKQKSKGSIRHITARINDGHTLDEFKLVIEDRVKEWGDNPKMSEYLRPETLFGTKFDGYLQKAKRVIKQEQSPSREPEVKPMRTIEDLERSGLI
jgi:uncharacterized phage protein (TIGR02220 family)